MTKAFNPAWPKHVRRARFCSRLAAQVRMFQRGRGGALGIFYTTLLCLVLYASASWSQQSTGPGLSPLGQIPITGGQGSAYLSQFANPALRGALYMTPTFPWTGIYPLYPSGDTPVIRNEGIRAGPVRLHPFMG